MTSLFSSETFSRNMRLILLYYLGYNILLVLIQLATISLMAFLHFLLDHDMGVIESWLNQNAWEILTFSKGAGFILMLKAIRLNLYNLPSFKKILQKKSFIPSLQILVVILFLNIMGGALFKNYVGVGELNQNISYLFVLTSYVGTSIFYLLDFLFVFYLFENISIVKKRNKIILLMVMGGMFLIVTNILQPYSKPNQLIILINFVTLLAIYFKNEENFINPILMCLGCVSLMTVLYGNDLVWKDQYSLIISNKSIPMIGPTLLWIVALSYYMKKRV
jgi:hypothetical protein